MSRLPRSRVVTANECRRERWRNGAGWTREILTIPASADDWSARLSIAEIEAEADYSLFPGVMREQALLSGDGLRLVSADGGYEDILPPHGIVRFPGEHPVRGRPLGHRVEAFNLMWRPASMQAQLLHRPLVGPMLFFCTPSVLWAVHVLGGTAAFSDADELPLLERGDTALLASDAGRRFILDGGGELLLARMVLAGQAD